MLPRAFGVGPALPHFLLHWQDCVTEGIDALALDDAWFIQAYPDIDLEGGSTVITQTRDMLAAKVGGWSVDFNPELRGDSAHGPSETQPSALGTPQQQLRLVYEPIVSHGALPCCVRLQTFDTPWHNVSYLLAMRCK